ncbi:MAG: hypothetical protein ACYTGC_05725 [Planctomycetota bacterium]|jgi:hypothetical protein
MSTTEAPLSSASPVETDAPVTILQCDRICSGCGFNLVGREVVREPRYELLVVRCPQCQTVMPVEEHPALGEWADRWRTLAAALWLLLLAAVAIGGVCLVGGLTIGMTIEMSDGYERAVRNEFAGWREGKERFAKLGTDELQREAFGLFWADRGSTLQPSTIGSLLRRVNLAEGPLILIPSLFATIAGLFWSVALLQWRRRGLALIAAVAVMAVIALIWLIRLLLTSFPPSSEEHVAWTFVYLPMLMMNILIVALVFITALVLGRSIARGLVLGFLPPRFRGALAILWTAEGLPAPPPPRKVLRRHARRAGGGP